MSKGDTWTLDQSEFENHLHARGVDIWMDESTMDIYLEAGSGYMHTSLREYVPIDKVIKMLEHQGYEVTKKHKA